MVLYKRKLALVSAIVLQQWLAMPVLAQQDDKSDSSLEDVTVTASRGSAGDINHAAATVSVITADEIEQHNAKDIKDALRYEPGVDVRRSAYRPAGVAGIIGRGGNEGISIRGLDGNRVLLLEDGVPLPRAYSMGITSAGRGAYTDTDLYQRIEILRGPASSLYGSDGLTGAVNFITKDPQDLLNVFGKNSYFSIRPSYDSVDHSFSTVATMALGSERWQGMLVLGGRYGNETDNKGEQDITGGNRSRSDPLRYNNRSVLGKLVFKASAQDTFKLTVGASENKTSGDGLSALSDDVHVYQTRGKVSSQRLGLSYVHDDADNMLIQKLQVALYYREAQTNQYAFEGGNTSVIQGRRTERPRSRDTYYDDAILGTSILAESHVDSGMLKHKLVYGMDASLSTAKASASGSGWRSCTGFEYCEHFPKTEYTVFGFYAQDEMRYGGLMLTPGLRYDTYELKPKASARYDAQAIANGQPAATSSDSAFSPRLALLYEVSPALIPYAQYARGFRAPSPYEVNSFFANTSPNFAYRQIANPALKPETSNSYELGLRGKLTVSSGQLRYSAAAFSGNYSNFIDMKRSGAGTPGDPTINQYVNAAKAKISGYEGKFDWRLNNGFHLKTGFAYTKGTRMDRAGKQTGLDSISPLSVVLGLRYEPNEHWFAQTDMIYNAAKNRADISEPKKFVSPLFFVTDISGGYRLGRHVIVYAGIRNLFDRKYWRWNDIRNLGDSVLLDGAANRDAYTEPGRSFNISAKFEY